jgi:archaellum component FlaC
MEAMRQSWSDDRLDHLNDRVDEGFRQVDEKFEQVDRRFEQVDLRFDQIDLRFDRVGREAREFRSEVLHRLDKLDDRFYSLQRTMLQVGGGLIGTMILAFGGVIATQL